MADESLVGQTIDKYQLLDLIGKGGMATVYRARQEKINRIVAIKLLPSIMTHDETFMTRFLREAKVIASLEHFHILPVYDYGEYMSMPYLVMRYLDGGSVHDLVARGPLDWQDIVTITGQVASALDYAHSHSVVHRDIKPSNILLDRDRNAYIADFGIARMGEGGDSLTGSGIIGTPAYMAPEQSSSNHPTPSIDVYALGITLFEMLTGQVPYYADTPVAQILMHLQQPVPSLRAYNPDIPEDLEQVVRQALAKNPRDRFQSAGQFAQELAQVMASYGAVWNGVASSLARPGLSSPAPHDAPTADVVPGQSFSADTAPARVRRRKSPSLIWLGLAGIVALIVLVVGAIVIAATLSNAVSIQPTDMPEEAMALPAPTTEPAVPTSTATVPLLPSPTLAPLDTPTVVPSSTNIPLTPTPQELSPTTFRRGVEMVLVPAGPFLMGRNEGNPDERPEHEVYLDAYYLDVTEVTNRDYGACVDALDDNHCPARGEFDLGSPSRFRYYGIEAYNDYPVILVSWDEAQAYCQWRGASLPTEAQWEKAARWDPESGEVFLFPWRTEILDSFFLNYNSELGDTTRVKNYPGGVSPVGAYDMSGNVVEWVQDFYQDNYYEASPSANPPGPASGDYHIIRGGSYESRGSAVTTTFRDLLRPATKLQTLGFRCAWVP